MKHGQSWLERHITLQSATNVESERENSISHLVGTIASLVFLAIVVGTKQEYAHRSTWIGMIVYAVTLLLLYLSSTLYHRAPIGDAKRVLRLLDHANIYLLIAGTYTPILAFIATPTSFLLLYVVWAVALIGILFSLLFWGKLKALHLIFYLGMGWMIVFFWNDIVPHLPAGLTGWILAAGVTYSVGVAFYVAKRMPHGHMVWHLFCVGASSLFCLGFLLHLTV
jgi:hemolysin III